MTKEITHTWPRGLFRAWVVIEPGVLEFMLYDCVVLPDGGMISFSKSSFQLALKATNYDYMGMGEFFPSANAIANSVDGDIKMINTSMSIFDSDDSEWHWLGLEYCNIMPCLGKVDNEERFMYEGDIIKYSHVWGIAEEDKRVFLPGEVAHGVIEWEDKRMQYVKQPHSCTIDTESQIVEVIGDRFRNKELLETIVFRK